MASYSYAGLEVRVTADTRGMSTEIRAAATSAGQDAARSIGQSMSQGLSAVGKLLGSIGTATVAGLGTAATAAVGFGVASFQTAARVGELDATLRALAKANNLSEKALFDQVKTVKDAGIQTTVAQGLVAQFARSQLNLADATKLAKVAQDAAVISQKDSSEVLDDLIHGITTQNSAVLRNAGLQVQAGQAVEAYAKSVGKSTKELTDSERAQAVLNAVLKDGESIAGAYAEAMTEPGKVLRSFRRVIEEVKLSVGKSLVAAFREPILQTYKLASAFAKAIEPGGVLAPIIDAIGASIAQLVAPLGGLIKGWSAWLTALKPEQVQRIVDVIKQFGPAILLAAGALAVFTGGGLLTQLPIVGSLFGAILGPVKLLVPTLLAVGKAALGVVGGLTGIGGAAGGAASGLSSILGPVGLVVAALALIATQSKAFREAVVALGRAVVSALKPALDALISGFKTALPPVRELLQVLGDKLAPIIQKLIPVLQPLGQLLATVITIAFKQVASAARALAPILSIVLDVLGWLIGVIAPVVGFILTLANGLLKAADAAGVMVSPLEILVGIFSAVAGAIASVVRWIFGGSPGLIPGFLAAAAAAGPLMGVLGALAGVFRTVASAISAAWSAVTGATKAAASAVMSATTSMGNAVRSVVTSAFNAVRSVVSSAMSAASSAVSSAMASIRSAASSGAAGVLSAISSAFNAIRGVVTSAMGAVPGIVSSALSSAVGAARSGGAAIMSGLQAGINSAAGAVMSTISSVAGKISGALSSALKIGSPSRLTIPMGVALMQGLEVGWDREVDRATWTTPRVPGGIGPGLDGLGGLGAGAGGATINVYPSAGMDERALAAMVSRELAWATAGGL